MMVMEYVDGESFQQMVDRRGPIPAQEIVPLFKQALLGLGAAHRMGIVHRDIKPSNIMLNKAGIVKVMDFGIAKAMGGSRGLTRTGIQVGTVFYMSPEQVKGSA
jgi:eukaryotic-like serine/threonine-protein kinase